VQFKAGTAFLFHGFSRSDGLIPDIVALNGYISIGPSILNDHAANYRAMARKIPIDRLLVETDRTEENASKCPHVREVLEKLAQIRGEDPHILEEATDANAQRFITQIDC
jgi:Tat protein secretion system quality control protein TatD with DNase activity